MKTVKVLWAYARNVFEIVTRFSYLLMYNLGLKHLNALRNMAGTTFFDERIAYFEPIFNTYKTLFEARQMNKQMQQGDTQDFNDLIEELRSTKIDAWDIAIQVIYNKKTSVYKRLLPRKRIPFQSGPYSEMVRAVKTLINLLAEYPALADIRTSVLNFYDLFEPAQNRQQQAITNSSLSSSDLEPARIACAIAMMVNLGNLIAHYATSNLAEVEKFFDVAAIRSHQQNIFVGTLAHDEFKKFIKRTFKPGQILRITTTQNVRWFLSKTATTFDGNMQETMANVLKDINVDDFMVVLKDNKNLIGLNLSGSDDAEVRIEVL